MYVKSFPDGSGSWVPTYLNDEQEEEVKAKSREEHNALMIQCINDAKEVIRRAFPGGDVSQVLYTTIAVALFDKQVSHLQYHRERLAKEVFDEMVSK